jgi:hypothetical protein
VVFLPLENPTVLPDNTTPGLMEKYKTELRTFHREKKEFQDNKAKVFVIILGQCTHNVKSKLENELGYATLEIYDDVVRLLRQHKHGGFNINYEKATVVWQQFGFGS